MREPASLLVTANNYVVGKVSSYGSHYLLFGLYQANNGPYVRVKVPLWNGPSIIMKPEEIHQFPENYEFNVPTVGVRHNRAYHFGGRS